MNTKPPEKSPYDPPKWPYKAAAVMAGIGLIGIVVLITFDPLPQTMTLEQIQQITENFCWGTFGVAMMLCLYGFAMKRHYEAKEARDEKRKKR